MWCVWNFSLYNIPSICLKGFIPKITLRCASTYYATCHKTKQLFKIWNQRLIVMQIQKKLKLMALGGIWRSIPTCMCVQVILVKLQLQVGEGRHKGLYTVDFTCRTFSTTIKWISWSKSQLWVIFKLCRLQGQLQSQNVVKISEIKIADGRLI